MTDYEASRVLDALYSAKRSLDSKQKETLGELELAITIVFSYLDKEE